MMYLFLATLISINGLWALTTQTRPADLFLIHEGNKVNGVMIVDPKDKEPIILSMSGTISRAKCGTLIELDSEPAVGKNKCEVRLFLIGCGKLSPKYYKIEATVVVGITCEGKKPRITTEDLSGIWVRKGSYSGTSI